MASVKEKGAERENEDKIVNFIQNHRRTLLAVLLLVVAGAVLFIAGYAIKDALEKKAIARVDEFSRRLNEIEGLKENPSAADGILEEINAFAPGSFGYAAARAYSLAAGIYALKKEWPAAEEAWAAAARKAPKIFLAPFALYNAAVAAEEQGNPEKSVEYHSRCVEYQGINPAAARSQFSIGRIREGQNNREGALEAYRKVIEKWPNDTNWANLAHSRIIVLEEN